MAETLRSGRDEMTLTNTSKHKLLANRTALGNISNAPGNHGGDAGPAAMVKRGYKDIMVKLPKIKQKTSSRELTQENNATKIKKSSSKIPVKAALPKNSNKDEIRMDSLTIALEETRRQPPQGIPDIDREDADFFRCPDYSQDIINYMMDFELEWVLRKDFLSQCGDKDITPNIRAVLIDWLVQVQAHLNLQGETLHMAVMMIDRFLCRQQISLRKIQLMGITCLFVASKFMERFPPEISVLLHLTEDTYRLDQVIKMELIVLNILKFDVNVPQMRQFLDRYLQASRDMYRTHGKKLRNLCLYFLDASLHDTSMVEYRQSHKAAASLCLAMKVLEANQDCVWTPTLAYYSTYEESQLEPVMIRYAAIIHSINIGTQKKFLGARNKYASRTLFNALSKSATVVDSVVIRSLAEA